MNGYAFGDLFFEHKRVWRSFYFYFQNSTFLKQNFEFFTFSYCTDDFVGLFGTLSNLNHGAKLTYDVFIGFFKSFQHVVCVRILKHYFSVANG